ncbi:isocitrate lyase/phosphoenolpyruvate mutase family protein [Streptomyces carminius]|uniref:Isocitrate lyase/phosphoenolpyruvate mutase family protein n=2 Tax=Streptomyces carminius TaxID=2665496 RepID=A0A2M8LPI0_9ACTN|nr:isocitrate lyase/phosphoenolpyruvate mutase family protein [Streptomyces carminius]PJE93873.1 isocitrate lyase/phosphoenolpyruvate mutase family protein [Streptomyces carminius]
MSAVFRELHRADRPLLLPCAWDHASAAALAAQGFPAIGTTSLGVAAAAGLADATGAARECTLELGRRLARLPVPVSVDIENGFADDPAGVAAFAAELAGAGVAGVNIEDGRPDGTLADPVRQAERVAAVREAAPTLFVNARTDTHWLAAEPTTAAALRRARRYLAAGADGVFVPGLADEDGIRALAGELDAPLNVLFAPGRHTCERLAGLGVRRISLGSLLFRAALGRAVELAVRIADPAAGAPETPDYARARALADPWTPPPLP